MADHQSFWGVTKQGRGNVVCSVNAFDLAASIEVASMQADRDQMPGTAQRMRNDAEFLRTHRHHTAILILTPNQEQT